MTTFIGSSNLSHTALFEIATLLAAQLPVVEGGDNSLAGPSRRHDKVVMSIMTLAFERQYR